MQQNRITYTYERNLQAALNAIGDRGICVSFPHLEAARIYVDQEIQRNLKIASQQWNLHVYVGAENKLPKNDPHVKEQINLNATSGENKLVLKLKDLGYDPPKIRAKTEEGEYEFRESAGELVLQKLLVASVDKYPGGDPAIRAVLRVKKLSKLRSSYINARLYQDSSGNLLYLSSYNAAGTLSGRRGSKKHIFGYGNNAQNFPTHGEFAEVFKRCLIARPGNIFLFVDQKSAEEWPVNALAKNYTAIAEMQSGVNRHIKLASYMFGVSIDSLTFKQWKEDIRYYLGKKTRHANNYGMGGQTMSDSLAKEGHALSKAQCDGLLEKVNKAEPNIKKVFHAKIEKELSDSRILVTPFGRERQFLGLRNNDYNGKIYREAYAYIPQSTVGDNNGLAILELETNYPSEERAIIQEGHDSIVQDIPAKPSFIWDYLQRTSSGFDRRICFDNGIQLQIPIEAELGYTWGGKVGKEPLRRKIKEPFSYENVVDALRECNDLRQQELDEEEKNRKDAAVAAFMATV